MSLSVRHASSVFTGQVTNCDNCGSFVKVGDLPVLTTDDTAAGVGAVDHRIACPQCCTEWTVTTSNGIDGEATLAVLQNEHKRDRSGKHRAVSNLSRAESGIEDDPDVALAIATIEQIRELEELLQDTCVHIVGRYSLRIAEEALPLSRSTISRHTSASKCRKLKAAPPELIEF